MASINNPNNPIEQYKKVLSMKNDKPSKGFEKIPEGDKKLRRVAKFLIIIGENEGAKVLKHLSDEEIEKICKEMSHIERIEREEALEILEEFGFLKETDQENAVGGIITARHFLEEAFGSEKAEEILEKAVPENFPGPFAFLDDVELPQLLHLIDGESPYVISLILCNIKPPQAAAVIKTLSNEEGADILARMARMGNLDKSVIEATASTLKDKLDHQGKWEDQKVNGQEILADILKHLDQGTEQRLLSSLKDVDEGLEKEVRERLFTTESVSGILDEDIQDALSQYQDKEIALLLKGKTEEFTNKIHNNLSSRRSALISEEMNLLGPVRRSDVDQFTKEFLDFLNDKLEKGDYRIIKDEEEYL